MSVTDIEPISNDVIANRICAFLAEQGIGIDAAADPLTIPLLEGDLLDSLGVVQLTVFLGEAFEVEISDDDFVAENFATVGTLVGLVQTKLRNNEA